MYEVPSFATGQGGPIASGQSKGYRARCNDMNDLAISAQWSGDFDGRLVVTDSTRLRSFDQTPEGWDVRLRNTSTTTAPGGSMLVTCLRQ